jgi:hypothetical protein
LASTKIGRLPHARFHDVLPTVGSPLIYDGVNVATVRTVLGHQIVVMRRYATPLDGQEHVDTIDRYHCPARRWCATHATPVGLRLLLVRAHGTITMVALCYLNMFVRSSRAGLSPDQTSGYTPYSPTCRGIHKTIQFPDGQLLSPVGWPKPPRHRILSNMIGVLSEVALSLTLTGHERERQYHQPSDPYVAFHSRLPPYLPCATPRGQALSHIRCC